MIDVAVVAIDPELPLPAYAKAGDAGADLVSRERGFVPAGGGWSTFASGIAIALPDGYAGFVQPRSGMALRHGVTVLNAPGLIDAGYRDEIRVILVNHHPTENYEVRRGDRIAQLVIQRVEVANFQLMAELPPSERGLGGFGHTGK